MNHYIIFSNRDQLYRINSSSILYFCADGNCTDIFLTSGQKITVTFSLVKMKNYLSEKLGVNALKFLRIGKKHIVNISFIYKIDILKQHLILLYENNGLKLLKLNNVSKEALKSLKDSIGKL